MLSCKIGEIVKSTAGRDKGRLYIITDIVNEKYVKLADGNNRKFGNEKEKNMKHLENTGYIAEELVYWLKNAKRVRNEDLKVIIRDYEKSKEA